MNEAGSQFSDTTLPPEKQPSTQFSENPLPAEGLAAPLEPAQRSVERRLRLWPGVAIIALQWAAVITVGLLYPATPTQFMVMFMGPVVGTLLILVWWLSFSRLPWLDRLLIPVACALYGVGTYYLDDPSLGWFGIMLYALPAAMTAWVVWLVISFPLSWPARRAGLLVVLMLAWGYNTLLRFNGADGSLSSELSWRWVPTKEQIFLAERAAEKASFRPVANLAQVKPLVLQPGDWPAFRGANRDGRLTGVKIPTDWAQHPPKLVWRHKVGPGWSSFAVIGNRLFTQEQWDKNEAVVCYDTDTGKIVWAHEDGARFTEVVAGPGPRATPTFHEGKLYTMGAAGKLNCLDAATGKVIWAADLVRLVHADNNNEREKYVWSDDILKDKEAKMPVWGFSASPLVVQGKVLVFAGAEKKTAVAYDAATGKFAWANGSADENGELSYSSLQLATVDGVKQALLATGDGLTAFRPDDGTVLWQHKWLLQDGKGARVVQPAQVGSADFLLGTGFGNGTRRLHVKKAGDKWDATEVWTSFKINPYFNDLVLHKDHLYGFDGIFFTCVSLDKGKSKWRARGYGNGQVLLIADQDLLLVVTEKGEAVLVEANPAEHKELGRFQAIEGKTWNHPVIAHGKLFVRNGEEAACYQLTDTAAGRPKERADTE